MATPGRVTLCPRRMNPVGVVNGGVRGLCPPHCRYNEENQELEEAMQRGEMTWRKAASMGQVPGAYEYCLQDRK